MTVTIDFAPDAIALIRRQAAAASTTAEDFIRTASEKAAQNAAYFAEIDRRVDDVRHGRNIVTFTDEEWEAFASEKELP